MSKKYVFRLLIAFILILLIVIFHFMKIDQLFFNYLNENKDNLLSQINNNYIVSVFIFILIYIVGTLLFSLVTLPLTMIAGFLFGTTLGAFYSVLGATLGSIIIFLLFKNLVGKSFQQKYHDKIINLNKNLKEYGSLYLLVLRLILITPFFLVSILSAFTNIPLFTFTWTTALGILPVTLFYSYMGKRFGAIDSTSDFFSWHFILIYIMLIIIIVLPFLLKKIFRKKMN